MFKSEMLILCISMQSIRQLNFIAFLSFGHTYECVVTTPMFYSDIKIEKKNQIYRGKKERKLRERESE